MELSFSLTEQSAVRTAKRQFNPFEIHTVKFAGAEIKEVGKETKYKILSISFENETGSANMSIFWPTEADTVRPVATAKDGHEYERASRWENTKAIIAQTLQVLNPEGYTKFQAASSKFKNFDDMANAFVKVVNAAKGKETNVKFAGYVNKQGYTQLSFPTIVGINKQGESFISDNYIGDVVLSSYEMQRAKEFGAPKPTPMEGDEKQDVPQNETSLDLDDLGL